MNRRAAKAARAEFRLFSRYLTGRKADAELADRYAGAVASLFPNEKPSAALRFARRHPWALGPLDAACALSQPEDPLRKRLLTAAAILEATPRHADLFLSRPASRTSTVLQLGWAGARASLKFAAGRALLVFLR